MQAVVAIDPAGGVIEEEARGIMRHRILVVARDVTLRSTLARWLMPAGYVVELAESDGRAREVFANHRVALTVLVLDRPGASAQTLDLGGRHGKLIVVREQSKGLVPLDQSVSAADAYLSLPLCEQEVLKQVKSVLEPQIEAAQTPENLSFEGLSSTSQGARCVMAVEPKFR